MNPYKNKEIMAEILFEIMDAGYFNIEPQAKLTLLSHGLESGWKAYNRVFNQIITSQVIH